jgi:hypothetical protein
MEIVSYSSLQQAIGCVICAVGNVCAVRSKASVSGRSLGGTAGSKLAGVMSVCCECYVLSGRGLFEGPIPCPEESCRLCVCR